MKIFFKKTIAGFIFCAATFSGADAANINLYSGTATYTVSGGYVMPFGSTGNYFSSGFGSSFSLNYVPSESSFLFFSLLPRYYCMGSISYNRFAVAGSPLSSLDIIAAEAGPVFYSPLFRYWAPFAGISVGGFSERLTLNTLGVTELRAGPSAFAHAGFFIPITSSLSFSAEGQYHYYFNPGSSLHAAGALLSFSYNFSGDYGNKIGINQSAVKIIRKETREIFAIRFAEYNEDGIGTMTIRNESDSAVYNVAVEVSIDGITDSKKSTDDIASLSPGEIKKLRIPVALSSDLLRQSADNRPSLLCTVIYSTGESKFYYTDITEMPVYSRNAIMWDETARLGSFIMPKNSSIAAFARRTLSSAANEQSAGIPRTLRDAAVLFDALHAGGFSYVSDPVTGYASSSGSRNAVDYVQLPGETLNRRGGDCDDLTVLYASLLESAGISTAIATLPGHVFVMFNTRISEAAYYRVANDKSSLLVREGIIWIPVEITKLNTPFAEAWKAGAAEMQMSGFEITETVSAWEKYPPSDGGDALSYSMPDSTVFTSAVRGDLASILRGSIGRKSADLIAKTEKDPSDYQAWSRLGALYGSFGLMDKAGAALEASLKLNPEFDQALVNMGNIYMTKKEYDAAAQLYKKAIASNPQNYTAYLNLAVIAFGKKKLEEASGYYDTAEKLNPAAAMRYRYLSGYKKD